MFEWQMTVLAVPGPNGNKKTASAPLMGQKLMLLRYHPNWRLHAHSLTRTIIRAPMDNGWDSRRPLLGFPFGPPSEVHSPADSCSDPTARNSLKGHLDWVLLSVIGLLW